MTAGFWLADLDVPRAPAGARVQPLTLDTLAQAGPADFVTAFDMIDRAPDLPALASRLARVLRPGGLLFLTAPNADGFDLQVLWDRYPALTPPDKLNVLSIAGLQRRLAAPDWELLEVSTPGMFDVEQVRRVVEAAPRAEWPRFVRTLLTARDSGAQRDFQEYLQRHRLASFARVVARRR
jgi:SAM-dependent methyltransferase